MTTIYTPALASMLAFFSAMMFLQLFGISSIDFANGQVKAVAIGVGAGFLMIGYGINALSPKIAGKLQVGMTVIKLIPLILMGVAGTIAGLVNGTTLEVLDYVNSADYVAVDGTGFFKAIVGFAFAYEGWILATSINAELKDSKKNLPRALVIGALVAGSRNLVDAVNWVQTLKGRDTIAKDVEKGKKAFVGPELRGKTLGVIGLGAIGARVANAAVALGMEVLGYDPYISIDAAWSLSRSVQHCVTLGDMLPRCDYLTIHVPYLPTTRHTINAQTLAMCKDGVRVLNYARGELVDNTALLDALNSGKVAQYFCDFPTDELLGVKGVCCTPHLGASTPESETNCAVMAAAELSDYLKNGNITHSVNMPEVHQPRAGGKRICIIHKNEPGMISQITALTTEAGLNIENMVNKSKKNMAYTMLDATGAVNDALAAKLSAIPAVVRVRIL